eukprot:3884378-Rhodomonas_salina.2
MVFWCGVGDNQGAQHARGVHGGVWWTPGCCKARSFCCSLTPHSDTRVPYFIPRNSYFFYPPTFGLPGLIRC